jgi:hypothetical protein
MQTLESLTPLGHVVEDRELLERSDADQRECTARLEPPAYLKKIFEIDSEILITTFKLN